MSEALTIHGESEHILIQPPKLVSLSYTAVYDTGAVQVGAVVHDGGEEPLRVMFMHAKGAASGLS
jgi:hypothetical protein